jgi:hypothetical protein
MCGNFGERGYEATFEKGEIVRMDASRRNYNRWNGKRPVSFLSLVVFMRLESKRGAEAVWTKWSRLF